MRRLGVLLLVAVAAAASELSSAEREVVRAADRVRPSVVTVYTEKTNDLNLTGVVISSRGVILTLRTPLLRKNGSLPGKVKVRFPGKGKTVEAKPIDDDPVTNTVLLQVSKMTTRAVQTRRAVDTRLGQWVLLVGNTFGAGQEGTPTVSLGVVSGLVRDGERILAIHASTLVNPGSFGAPVVDVGGGLIGITAFKVTRAGGQSVVLPFDFIRDRYKRKGKKGATIMANAPRKRGPSTRITDLFGRVMEAAAARARDAVVGVRAAKLDSDQKPPPPPEVKPGETKPPGGRPRVRPPMPKPVPGSLPAYDRSSGVVVSADGLIVCPLRVTGWPGPERPLLVDLADGRSLPAKLLGKDERTRLALIAVEAQDLVVLEDGSGRTLRAGQFVLALGYPHENPRRGTPQVTFGIVSRTRALQGLHPALQAVQTDAGVGGGNRGGALVDIEGRLVGVLLDVNDTEPRGYTTRARGSYAGNAGLGFAVPIAVLRSYLPRLAKGETFSLGFLGVGTEPAEGGLRIANLVERNSKGKPTTAVRAGLKKGDLLVSLAGHTLKKPEDLRAALATVTVGDEIEIVLVRAGERKSVKVELGER